MSTKQFQHGLFELVVHTDQVSGQLLGRTVLVKLVYHIGHASADNVSPARCNDSNTVPRLQCVCVCVCVRIVKRFHTEYGYIDAYTRKCVCVCVCACVCVCVCV